jgi:uncharacterized protein YgiM (DUF1202 family)
MKKILPIAVLAAGLAAAGTAYAGSSANSGGGVGTNVGDSMSEPMVVSIDNGNVREQPNPTSKILTTVPHGHRVTMIGTANGGAWAHVMVDGLDGYMDLVQLDKAPAEVTYNSTDQAPLRYMIVDSDNGNVRAQPTTESALLVTLPRGSRVALLGSTASGWSHIQGNGVDGYIDSAKLAYAGPATYTVPYTVPYGTVIYQPQPTYQVQPTYQTTYPSTYPTYQYSSTPTYSYQTTPTYSYQTTPTYSYQTTPTYQVNSPVYPYGSTVPYGSNARVVNSGGGTVHQTPDAQSPLLTTLPPGYQVSVLGSVNGTWAHVVANGVDGYMAYYQLQ